MCTLQIFKVIYKNVGTFWEEHKILKKIYHIKFYKVWKLDIQNQKFIQIGCGHTVNKNGIIHKTLVFPIFDTPLPISPNIRW